MSALLKNNQQVRNKRAGVISRVIQEVKYKLSTGY